MVDFARCEGYLKAALEYDDGSYEIEDVLTAVAAGHMQFWPGNKSAVVTQVVEYPQRKNLHYFLAGGDIEELERMAPFIEKWAREQGCKAVTLAGRRGWERTFLKQQGYSPKYTVMAKELE
jgi:hypothetical protein